MTSRSEKLAQELHDGIAQDLIALGFSIDSILALNVDAQARAQLRELRFSLTELVNKVRHEIHQLRTTQIPQPSLADSSLTFELQRVLVEIIRNIEEHSRATHMRIEVSDNGIGGAKIKEGSFGLIGLQERIENLNGVIDIESHSKGTKISLEIPLE